MAKKFIPNGDGDFNRMAASFARAVGGDPARYGVSIKDSQALDAAVAAYAAAYQRTAHRYQRSPASTAAKEEARRAAEAIIRRLAAIMRANPSLDPAARVHVGLQERAKSTAPKAMPNEAPRLSFKRAIHEGGFVPEHELEFRALGITPRPPGALRLELFVELIPPDVDVHSHYQTATSVRPIYVRSFVKSPIRLVPPMADVPMRVIYFARWADADGEVGPMAGPVAGWVEGGSHHLMHAFSLGNKKVMRIDIAPDAAARDATILLALLSGEAAKRLTATDAVRQIEGQLQGQLEGMVDAEAA